MRCIVTGGAGFLGRHLCRALVEEGHQVKVVDLKSNPEYDSVIADIRDQQAMLQEIRDADVVYHLAALIEVGESVKDPRGYINSNILGTLNVLEAMHTNGIDTIFFSSTAAVYGEPKQVPILEDSKTIPINPYGMTKLAVEGLLSSYVASYGMTAVVMRYFNLYGPEELHEPETHAIPRFIKQIYNNEEVTVWGNGENQRDFIYIGDVVEAHIKALKLAATQPKQYHYMNLSSEQPTSVAEVIALLEKTMGKQAQIKKFPPRAGDPLLLYADATKAHTLLEWHAQTSLKTGLEKTVQYFLSRWHEQN
jgi:UDP-glucose 4-epimerase